MRVLIVLSVLAALASAQGPTFLYSFTVPQINEILADKARVEYNIACLLKQNDCTQDELSRPLQNTIAEWASTKSICNGCDTQQKRKVTLVISRISTDYPKQYETIRQLYGLF